MNPLHFSHSEGGDKNAEPLGLAHLDEQTEGTFFFDDSLAITETMSAPKDEMEKIDAEEIQRRIDSLREFIRKQRNNN